MRLIDTHTHLDFPDFDADRDRLLTNAAARGVERMVVLGCIRPIGNGCGIWSVANSGCSRPWACIRCTSTSTAPSTAQLRAWLERLRGDPRLCAVGEFGLDYYLPELDKERQQALFEAQLQLACDFDLPALLHVRRSHAQVIATLKRYKPARAGIIHAFAGSYEEAREYIKLGFRLGLGGAATWPQALRLRKTLPRLPLESVVLETDAPDMAPVMFPGERNSPEHLPEIAHALAEVMGIDAERLAQISSRNACELFGW